LMLAALAGRSLPHRKPLQKRGVGILRVNRGERGEGERATVAETQEQGSVN